ncbi:hypothetical protein E2C01_043316 [Portunus trituberculatus]|uniref:Uncharacterized protein n=1 Tax=Portunus trituberculatus TaxID=210409 RepID=A0A5B7FWZ9_PORTR|nr:hypothetical protein [Portunus trituberculatus]
MRVTYAPWQYALCAPSHLTGCAPEGHLTQPSQSRTLGKLLLWRRRLGEKEAEETVRGQLLINSFPLYQCPPSIQIPLGSPRGSTIPRMRLFGLLGRVSVFVIKENASTMHSFVRGARRGLPE